MTIIKDWRACAVWEEPHNGIQKMAAVRKFSNRYGYESEVYASPCAGQKGRFAYLKCWHGVPLRTDVTPPPTQDVGRRQKLVIHHLPDLIIDHGPSGGALAGGSPQTEDSQVARLLSVLVR